MQTTMNILATKSPVLSSLSKHSVDNQLAVKGSVVTVIPKSLHSPDSKPLTSRNARCKEPEFFEDWRINSKLDMSPSFIQEHIPPCLESCIFLHSREPAKLTSFNATVSTKSGNTKRSRKRSAGNSSDLASIRRKLAKIGISTNSKIDTTFNHKHMMFGEEFEYTTNIEYSDSLASFEGFEKLLLSWKSKLESKLTSLNVIDFEIHDNFRLIENFIIEKWKQNACQGFKEKYLTALKVRIGEWHCVIFKDLWDEISLLEINTSAYRLDQTFKVDNQNWKVSDLFTKFITSIADDFFPKNNETTKYPLEYASGHKHVDLRDSVGGNPELLFRMLVEVEDKAWLTQYFNTHGYSPSSHRFATQGEQNKTTTLILKTLVDTYNNAIKDKSGITSTEMEINNPLITLWLNLFSVSRFNQKYIPLKFRKLLPSVTNNDAKSGFVVQNPSNTGEFRIYNCARDGDEAIMISRFQEAWIKTVYQDMIDKKTLVYKPCDPLQPIDKQQLTSNFNCFINRLGLPDDFQRLYRDPVQE